MNETDPKITRFLLLVLLTPIIYLYAWITGDRALWRKWRKLLRKSFPWRLGR